jgi:predicted dehydrogenase
MMQADDMRITPGDLGIPESIPLPRRSDWRIGLIGFGGFANAHRRAYQSVGWTIAAVADPLPAARERARELTGAERLYADYRELLADPSIDVAVLLTQPTLREEVVRAAVEAGKPMMTEKPLAGNMAECERIADRVERARLPFAVSQDYRWRGVNFHVHHIIRKGLIGRPYYASIEIQGRQDEELASHGFYATCADFLTVQWNTHLADLLRHWTGGEPRRVCACTRRMPGQNFASDNWLLSLVDFEEGLVGHILHNELLRSSLTGMPCRVEGDEGSLVFELSGSSLRLESRQLGKGVRTLDVSGVKPLASQCGSLGDLLIAIEEGREPLVSARRNLATMRHVLAEKASVAAGGIWVDV